MARREIIQIDEEKCNGCGACVIQCAEGALEIIDGKARLVSDIYCDGLGACLGECPTGALTIVVRDAAEFDEEAVGEHLNVLKGRPSHPRPETLACGCPGSVVQELKPAAAPIKTGPVRVSALRNFPLQLHLVPTKADFYNQAGLVIAADCAGFALTALHADYLPDNSLIIACPKLDETGPYQAKLAEIFRRNLIKGITVLYMVVPCCFGLVHLVREALRDSGKSIPLRLVKVDPQGEIIQDELVKAA
ncbi:MAG: 4Fe-4S binding protein [Thermodesulfobacteriota bacterium]